MSAVRLLLPEGGLDHWRRALAEQLAADGHRVLIALRPRRGAPPPSTELIEALEDLLRRGRRPTEMDREAPGAWSAVDVGEADLVFDLTGSAEAERNAIVPCFDGAPGDGARDAALLDGRAPWIELTASGDDGPLVYASALPALARRDRLIAGRAAVAVALSALVRRLAARGIDEARPPRPSVAATRRGPFGFAAASLAALVARRLRRLVARDDHWRIGVRHREARDLPLSSIDSICAAPWRWLPDDGRRRFSDPFLFQQGGVDYVFCEEFQYATGKGVVSVFALDDAGEPGPPHVVLERPYRLSYPVVFRSAGEIWMMPETGANRTLELYRAEKFPDQWTLDRVLIDGVELAGATPFGWAGGWWLTAASPEATGSTWDSLSLFSGPGPLGPWTPAIDGPALIDASAARPAGRFFTLDRALWRPARDCRAGYRAGLSLCRVDAVGPGRFEQTPILRFAAPGGLQTFNANKRFVVIDAAGA